MQRSELQIFCDEVHQTCSTVKYECCVPEYVGGQESSKVLISKSGSCGWQCAWSIVCAGMLDSRQMRLVHSWERIHHSDVKSFCQGMYEKQGTQEICWLESAHNILRINLASNFESKAATLLFSVRFAIMPCHSGTETVHGSAC